MPRSHRYAFTLVELLVVITIIGMLMALLLPAVNSSIESARQLRCKNRLAQIAKATNAFESRLSRYPGYRNGVSIREGASEDPRISWLTALLPDLERADLYELWKTEPRIQPEMGPYLEMLTCPSDPPLDTSKGWTSYVGNAGKSSGEERPECGIMHDYFRSKVFTSAERVSGADGTTSTLLLTENVQASTWFDVSDKRSGANAPFNIFVWHDRDPGSRAEYLINGNVSGLPPNDPTLPTARPSSFHNGGVNVAFCDTHVIFMREGIDYRVYAQLMTPDGKRCPANRINLNTPLNDNDYK